jgi:cytochrome P450
MTTRMASQDDVINGFKVPKGTLVFIPIGAINFDEQAWGPDVDNFNPDRWDKLPEAVTHSHYLTFIQGPRACIGRRFAEVEMKVLMVSLIQQFRFEEVEKGRIIEKKSSITTRPKGGMHLKISIV